MANSRPPKTVENLVDLLRWRAEMTPSKQGFRFLENGEGWGQRLSFSDLDRRARAIAARVSEEVEPGERVLLLYPPSLEYVEAFFGCLYAGAVAVPAYPPNPRRLARTLPRLRSIVEDAGANLALTTGAISGMAQALASQEAGLGVLDWVATDEIADEERADWKPVDISEEDVAFLQYTSGSTGKPKGVVLKHKTMFRNNELICQAFSTGPDDVGVTWLPLYHDMGLIGAVIHPVYTGCTSVLMSPLDFLKRPARWLEAMSRFNGTMSTAPNFGYDLAARKTAPALRDKLDLSKWRIACNGAEPVRPATVRRFSEYFEPCGFETTSFLAAYGLAEVGLIVSATPEREDPRTVEVEGKEQISCGPPLGDFEVRIVKTGTRRLADDGEVGEIWLRGDSVAPGYWRKEEVNAEVFQATLADGDGPYLKTGDMGLVSDGDILVTGRLKDLIVIRGVNHYPQDIEATVETVDPAMRPGCGAAFSIDVDEEEALVVVHEVKPDQIDDLDQLVQRIREAITSVHRVVPHDVVLIEPRTIEKTSSGKIQRFAACKAYKANTLSVIARGKARTMKSKSSTGSVVNQSEPSDPTDGDISRAGVESWLVAKVAEASGAERAEIDLDAPFSVYGVDSAEAVGIVGELENWLERNVASTALYDFPTISALAVYLSGEEEAESPRQRWNSGDNATPEQRALAVVGMACRFPGADGIDEYWELLKSGRSAIELVDEERWTPGTFTDPDVAGLDTMATDKGGFLDDISEFDASYFGISPREAQAMDPQQRLVLETSWHAIEDAGIKASELGGSATGVFIGQGGSDFARLYDGAPVRAGSGMASSIASNRISYWLDLHGPSATIDTACSSSLVALDQAMMNLRIGRCDAAIVGGVNVILAPDVSVAFSQARMLSPNGQCRVFDKDADGYVRGEGCGVVVVKRLSDALRDGDRIRAVIRGGSVNQDGRTNGLTAPSGPSQSAVIRAALADAGVEANSIGAIEAHGTGTELGDAIEARALRDVFDGQKQGREAIRLGSVKAQIGHLEAGSGMAGLIKAALMAERGVFMPQPAYDKPNPSTELDGSIFSIGSSFDQWPGGSEGAENPRRVGVSSFGFGGTNAHIIVEEPPAPRWVKQEGQPGPGLICISAGNNERLKQAIQALVQQEDLWSESPTVRDIGRSLGAQRDERRFRHAMVADDVTEARQALEHAVDKADEFKAVPATGFRVGFAFTGQGSQYMGMGRRLYSEIPLFRKHFDEAISAIEAAGCEKIRDVVDGTEDEEAIETAEYAQPALFAFEVALAKVFIGWGVVPNVVVGHSAGEFAAGHICGELSLEHAARLVVERGRRMQELDGGGAMAAVFESEDFVTDALSKWKITGVDIAAINGDRHIVVSGDADQVNIFDEKLRKENVKVRPLVTSHAFHSGRIEPMIKGFFEEAGKIRSRKRRVDFVSTVEGRLLKNDEKLDADYWRRQIRQPVRFAEAVEEINKTGVDIVLEIGPRDTLLGLARQLKLDDAPEWLATVRGGDDGARRLMEVAARMWSAGVSVDPTLVNDGGRRVKLPKTPFLRRRHWPDNDLRKLKAGE